VGSSLGEMAIPALVTSLFATTLQYFSLVLITFVGSVIMMMVWVGFVLQRRSMEKRGVLVDVKKPAQEEIEYNPAEETPLVKTK